MVLAIGYIERRQVSMYTPILQINESNKRCTNWQETTNYRVECLEKTDLPSVLFVNADRRLRQSSRSEERSSEVVFAPEPGRRKGAEETWWRGGSGRFVLGYLYMPCAHRRHERELSGALDTLVMSERYCKHDGQIKGLLPNYSSSVNCPRFRPQSSTRPVYV